MKNEDNTQKEQMEGAWEAMSQIGNNMGNPTGTDKPTRTLSRAGGIPCLLWEGMPTGSHHRVLHGTGVMQWVVRQDGMLNSSNECTL